MEPPTAFVQPPVCVVLPIGEQFWAAHAGGAAAIIATAINESLFIFNILLFWLNKNRQIIGGREVEKSYFEMTLGFWTDVLLYNHRPPTGTVG